MNNKIHREDNTFVITKNGYPYHVTAAMSEYSGLLAEYGASPETFAEEAIYTPSLAEIKQAARVKITEIRNRKESEGFAYQGMFFDSDALSIQRLMCAAQSAAHNPEFTVNWTLKDNSEVSLSSAQIQGVVAAFSAYNNTLHQTAAELKTQINEAENASAVAAVVWEDN